MNESASGAGDSLCSNRERRFRRVRFRLHCAALELAADRRVSDITVEEIAAEAGVSRRTFFHYFPTKNHAFIPDLAETPPRALADFRGALIPDFLEATEALLLARSAEVAAATERYRQAMEVWEKNPELNPLTWQAFRELETQMGQAVSGRLGMDSEDPVVTTAATLVVSLEKSALRLWQVRGMETDLRQAIKDSVQGLVVALGGDVGLDSMTMTAEDNEDNT